MSDPATPTPRTTGGNVRWEPPSPAELQEQMPGYTIEKLLGRGGMGAVYKGVQSNLDRTVAIKILPPGVEQEDPSFAERFKNEARLMARLNNPAVVSVHDFGLTTGGLLYFAMEYVDGTDVSQMIRSQGKLPPEHALAITAHVCDALSAAHELGIVHRDIKPANVLINMKGQVKVADFGLAKIEEPGTHGLTKTGYAMGTPDFVAPEVLMLGSHIDGRADLYAVGVMLYQMLTGEVPRGAFKPATARLPGLDPRFDPIILKAMQSDREERYQSSTELRRDLDVILTVPLVRQDEPPTSAIPAAQVAQTPAQRSAVQKRSADAPVRSASKAGEGTRAPLPPKKSSTPLLLGLGAAAAIGIGAFVMLGGGEKAQQSGPLSPLSGTSVAPAPKAAQGTERSTTPPPVKVSEPPKPAVQVPTWLQEARKRGGKLRFFASGKAQALIEKGETENFDDFIEVAASSHGWIARRANGETHVVGWVPESWPAGTPIKPTTVSRITRGHQFALCSARDGSFLSIHNIINGQIQGGKLAHKDSAAILNVHGHMVSLAADGKVLLQSATLPDSKHPPESFFRGSHGLTATVKHYIVAKPSAPPSSWNISGGFLRTFPSEITNVVELDAAGEQVICLTATGQVKVTNPEGSPLPASRSNLNPPTGLATAITVRAGNGMCAAQKTDGTWLAWGSSKELVEQVQKIGVALDLDLHVAGTTPFMLWVEPTSVSMIADKKPSAPTPAAAKPSAPPPSATTSPLPSLPLPAPKQWIDATAAVKAAAGTHQEAVPGGWRATDLIPVAAVSDAKPRNAVCRVQHRGPLFLSLRFTMGQGSYQGSLESMGKAVVRFVDYADGKYNHVTLALGAVPAGFKQDDSHVTMFAAQGDELTLWIDGQLVARATDTRLTAGPTRLRVDKGTIIEKVEYAELPDEAAVASSPSPSPSATTSPPPSLPLPAPKQWMDATAAVKAAAGPDLEAVPGGWRATALVGAIYLNATAPRNAVCRVQHRGPVALSLRLTGQGAYECSLNSIGRAEVTFHDFADGNRTLMASGTVPAGFKRDDSHVTMFAARGDELSLWLNGQLVAKTEDKRLTAGRMRLRVEKGTIIEKVDYAELPDEAAVAPSPSLPAPPSPAPTIPELATLDAQFKQFTVERVTLPFVAEVENLNTGYLGGLDRKMAEEKAAGHLDSVLAIEVEKKRIADKQAIPSAEDDATSTTTPAVLKTLRQIYRDAYAKIEATRASNLKALTDPLTTRLKTLESDLTKQDRIADARTVKEYREALAGRADAPSSAAVAPQMALGGSSASRSAPALVSATKDKPFTNSLGMKFVPVPGTDILMCMHETRYKDYAAHAAEAKVADRKWMEQTYKGFAITERKEEHPVANVSWDDAQAFCAWLSQKEGRVFRLPTDREWSMAVGIGRDEQWRADTTPATVFKNQVEYPWGDRWPPPKGSGNFADESCQQKGLISDGFIAGYDDGFPSMSPVMAFKPNKLGIYDMGGNVLEWCEDWYDSSKVKRVSRGSAWRNTTNTMLMSSFRLPYQPELRDPIVGFRIVLDTRAPASPSGAATKPDTPTPAPASTPATAAKSDFTNSLGMQFVKVPGTKVLFCIHETRKGDYAKYAAETPGVDERWNSDLGMAKTDLYPVTLVNWHDAKAFCSWISKKESRAYRLPTDREWSYAVGIANDENRNTVPDLLNAKILDEFPWGRKFPPPPGADNLADESWKRRFGKDTDLSGYADGFEQTSPVMSFQPNKLGIYDLGGNVGEWCEDWSTAQQIKRVRRGGSWNAPTRQGVLSSGRSLHEPIQTDGTFGFRIVLETNE